MAVITDTEARNIKPDDKPIPHVSVTGLALHPSSKRGRGKWVLRFLSPQTHIVTEDSSSSVSVKNLKSNRQNNPLVNVISLYLMK